MFGIRTLGSNSAKVLELLVRKSFLFRICLVHEVRETGHHRKVVESFHVKSSRWILMLNVHVESSRWMFSLNVPVQLKEPSPRKIPASKRPACPFETQCWIRLVWIRLVWIRLVWIRLVWIRSVCWKCWERCARCGEFYVPDSYSWGLQTAQSGSALRSMRQSGTVCWGLWTVQRPGEVCTRVSFSMLVELCRSSCSSCSCVYKLMLCFVWPIQFGAWANAWAPTRQCEWRSPRSSSLHRPNGCKYFYFR